MKENQVEVTWLSWLPITMILQVAFICDICLDFLTWLKTHVKRFLLFIGFFYTCVYKRDVFWFRDLPIIVQIDFLTWLKTHILRFCCSPMVFMHLSVQEEHIVIRNLPIIVFPACSSNKHCCRYFLQNLMYMISWHIVCAKWWGIYSSLLELCTIENLKHVMFFAIFTNSLMAKM